MAQVRTGRPLKNCSNSLGLLEYYDANFRQEILLPNWPRKKPHGWEATTYTRPQGAKKGAGGDNHAS